MLDLDYFKKINDTLGHLAGDAVLAEMSGQLPKPPVPQVEKDLLAATGRKQVEPAIATGSEDAARSAATRVPQPAGSHPRKPNDARVGPNKTPIADETADARYTSRAGIKLREAFELLRSEYDVKSRAPLSGPERASIARRPEACARARRLARSGRDPRRAGRRPVHDPP